MKKDLNFFCQGLASILTTSLKKKGKKWKLDLTFSRRFYRLELSVEKARKISSCGSSSYFPSSKTCSFSWCNATFSFNGKSTLIITSQRRRQKHHLHIQETNNFKKERWKRCERCVLHDSSCPCDVCVNKYNLIKCKRKSLLKETKTWCSQHKT